MNFIKTVSLITFFSTSSAFSFDWSTSVYSLFFSLFKTFTTCSWISDHCMPANHQEFCQTKEEIKQMFKAQVLSMESHAQRQREAWYKKTKKEFERKISLNVQACSQKSLTLQNQMHQTQTRTLKIIENHHKQRMQSLKNTALNHTNQVEISIENILIALKKAQEEHDLLLQRHHDTIVTFVKNLPTTFQQKYENCTKSISQKYTKLRASLIENHEQRDQKLKKSSHLWKDSADLTSKKLESLEKLCTTLATALTLEREKNKKLTQYIHCLKISHADNAQQSIQSAFGYKKITKRGK